MGQSTSAVRRIRLLWEAIIEPPSTITDLRARQQIRMFTSILLPFILITAAVAAVYAARGRLQPVHLVVFGALFGVKLVCLVLGRTRFYQAGVLVFVGVLVAEYIGFVVMGYAQLAYSLMGLNVLAVFVVSLFFPVYVVGWAAVAALGVIGFGIGLTGAIPPVRYLVLTIGLSTYFIEIILFVSFIRHETTLLIEQQTDALVESESRFRSIFDQTFQFASFLRPDGFIIDVNEQARDLFQEYGERAIGRYIWDLDIWGHADHDAQEIRGDIDNAITHGEAHFEVTFTKSTPPLVFDMHLRPIYDESGEIYLLMLTGRNITALKQAERTRQIEAERYQMLFEQMGDGILLLGLDRRIIVSNPAWATMLGYSTEETRGLNIRETFHPDELPNFQDLIKKLERGEQVKPYERQIRHKDGHYIPVEVHPTLVQGGDGEPMYIQTVFRDLTARKREERHQLELEKERERLKLLHDFISDVSHDLRQPLTNIKNSAYLVKRIGTKSEERLEHYMGVIDESTDVLHQIIENQLSAVRNEAYNEAEENYRFPINLNELVQNVTYTLQPQADQHQDTLTLNLGEEIPVILGNSSALQEALTHIVSNAIRFTPEEGHIHISTHAGDSYVQISVKDDGIGIHDKDLSYIFDSLYRADNARQQAGSGLGLTIAQNVIQSHGGHITVESTPDVGSLFTLHLPKIRTNIQTSD